MVADHALIELYRKPIVALAHMILHPDEYHPDALEKLKLGKDERAELKLAQTIMQGVLDDLHENDPNSSDLQYGKHWELCGSETVSPKFEYIPSD